MDNVDNIKGCSRAQVLPVLATTPRVPVALTKSEGGIQAKLDNPPGVVKCPISSGACRTTWPGASGAVAADKKQIKIK